MTSYNSTLYNDLYITYTKKCSLSPLDCKNPVAVTQRSVPRTKPNKPCDGNRLGTPSPYNRYFVGAPTNTSSRDWAH